MKRITKMNSKKTLNWNEESQIVKSKANKRDRRQGRENKRNFEQF